jgi:hypothetical protein
MSEDVLVQQIRSLPDEVKKELFDFAEFLIKKHSQTDVKKTPKAGFGKDLISYIAPDFDAPLDEFKEYME